MSGAVEFHFGFKYEDDNFNLVRDANSSHPIKINGVTYEIQGDTGRLEGVYKILQSAHLESATSEDALKAKLSAIAGISVSTTKELGKTQLISRAKAAEDVPAPYRPSKRRLSAPQLGRAPDQPIHSTKKERINWVKNQLIDKEECEKKSSKMWTCVGRTPDKGSNGYIYKFKLKDEYDGLTKSTEQQSRSAAARKERIKIFPAVEPIDFEDIRYLNPSIRKDLMTDRTKNASYENGFFLQQLGFKYKQTSNGAYLSLPDRETFLARWEQLREDKGLPALNIASSFGIAGDLAFVEAHLLYDAIISEGEEFVHDLMLHVKHLVVLINTMSNAKNYSNERVRFVRAIINGYRKLMIVKKELKDGALSIPEDQCLVLKEHLNKIEMALGIFVDSTQLMPGSNYKKALENVFTKMYSPLWVRHIDNKFGAKNIGTKVLEELWDQMEDVEEIFDALRKPEPAGE